MGHKMFAACAGDNLFFRRGIIRTIAVLNLILTKAENNLAWRDVGKRKKMRATKEGQHFEKADINGKNLLTGSFAWIIWVFLKVWETWWLLETLCQIHNRNYLKDKKSSRRHSDCLSSNLMIWKRKKELHTEWKQGHILKDIKELLRYVG